MSAFTPVTRPQHLPARIAATLTAQIESGVLKPGDRLPTEQALTRSFAVSRTVIREAIAQLRNEGLIETRQGAGAFVIQRAARHIRLDDARAMAPHAFRDLFQLRLPLEIEAAALAALHRGPQHLAQLDDAMARMTGGASGEEVIEADLHFHRTIAAATGNAYFVQFLGAISDRILHTIIDSRVRQSPAEIAPHVHREHRAIHDAILSGHAAAARAAMRAHMLHSAERVGLSLHLSD
ncbi:FadR/GntR family transcriptional regulator [Halodurantibacterium flavum]|uniref:FadR/GntR family transcriptional regulator n=1 Tax=Halodurantibacterium flavum TaxID=1382802 RepID=A0ABW4RZB7_9RHOB